MKLESMEIEQHPLEPFLPGNARLLMLGSFPPQKKRWSMEFYYPNWNNDMWRITGFLFFNDKDYFVDKTKKAFCKERLISFLQARGIDPARLILEERSANTRQNLQNSLALLPDDYHKTVAIVTNDFHMGRVRLLLNAAGPGRVVQVPAKLPWWWLSANYYLRESFAVVNDQVVRPLLA